MRGLLWRAMTAGALRELLTQVGRTWTLGCRTWQRRVAVHALM